MVPRDVRSARPGRCRTGCRRRWPGSARWRRRTRICGRATWPSTTCGSRSRRSRRARRSWRARRRSGGGAVSPGRATGGGEPQHSGVPAGAAADPAEAAAGALRSGDGEGATLLGRQSRGVPWPALHRALRCRRLQPRRPWRGRLDGSTRDPAQRAAMNPRLAQGPEPEESGQPACYMHGTTCLATIIGAAAWHR